MLLLNCCVPLDLKLGRVYQQKKSNEVSSSLNNGTETKGYSIKRLSGIGNPQLWLRERDEAWIEYRVTHIITQKNASIFSRMFSVLESSDYEAFRVCAGIVA